MKVKKSTLRRIVAKFHNKKILVIGDLILDHYIFGGVERISPEAPVPVVWANKENFVCGGGANVGLNLVSLGAETSLCGVVGTDHYGEHLFSLIKKGNIDTSLIIKDKQRPTTLKTRIIAHHQQVVRLDWESVEFLSYAVNKKILDTIKRHIDEFDAVIIEDYGKGMVNPTLVADLVQMCNQNEKIVTVDPKEDHFDYYENVTALTPNLKEAQMAANIKVRSRADIPLLGRMLMQKLKLKALLVTLGEQGMIVFADNRHHTIASSALEVFDVTGAGDTVIAAFTLALSCGATFYEAATVANIAAGIVVGKLGAATTDKRELLKRISDTRI